MKKRILSLFVGLVFVAALSGATIQFGGFDESLFNGFQNVTITSSTPSASPKGVPIRHMFNGDSTGGDADAAAIFKDLGVGGVAFVEFHTAAPVRFNEFKLALREHGSKPVRPTSGGASASAWVLYGNDSGANFGNRDIISWGLIDADYYGVYGSNAIVVTDTGLSANAQYFRLELTQADSLDGRLGVRVMEVGVSYSETPAVRVLAVGNSFARNATRYLPNIIKSDAELRADIGLADIGGCPLDKHVRLFEEHEADAGKGNEYAYTLNGHLMPQRVSLKFILQSGDWDYVTIQQVSGKSYKVETFSPYTEELMSYIHKYSPKSKIVIHETWSHSVGSHRVKTWNLDPDDMYAQLHAAYGQVAEDFELDVIPVGTAFQNAKKRDLWDYQPTSIDTSKLVYPEDKNNLPDESKSLHDIYDWIANADGTYRLRNDGSHASLFGQYLGSLVWYEFFFDKDVRTVIYTPAGVSEAQGISLREIAHDTVSSVVGK